ncbi:hypothetical protein BC831DRAFT_461746 [Entophlyctis helioformis]|nr:hypothetical protein BC831DRAFT_461746 [Entophlyctis helioformis]
MPKAAVDDHSKHRDYTAESHQLVADLIDCDRRDYGQVRRILSRISELVSIHIRANATRYLYEEDSVSTPQEDTDDAATASETGLQALQRHCTPWLVSVLHRVPETPAGCEDDSDLMDDISGVMSMLSGRTGKQQSVAAFCRSSQSVAAVSLSQRSVAAVVVNALLASPLTDSRLPVCACTAVGECTTAWHLQNTGTFELIETTYTEAEIGFQTWGGGVMLAKMIDQMVIDVTDHNVLELGCGTGLTGLVAARAGSRLTVLTDYHPTVLNNVQRNVEANNLERTARVVRLDWLWSLPRSDREAQDGLFTHGGDAAHETPEMQRQYALDDEYEDPILTSTDFRLVIAADCIFDMMHSELVPKVAKKYISRHPSARFHVLLPHRTKFREELKTFEANMPLEGWILEDSRWIEKDTINFRYYVFKLDETAAQ